MKIQPWIRALVKILAVGLGAVLLLFVALMVGFDLRIELAGNGFRPIVSFGDTEEHYEILELNRSQHYSRLLPAGSSSSIDSDTAAPPEKNFSRQYWTDFRGPNRDGHYDQVPLLKSWPGPGLEPLWIQPIGGGYASFVVAENRAFTIEQRREQEVVVAYDVVTGRELWTHAWEAYFNETLGGPGPRATPTWHDGRLYALGATGHFWCLDATTGEVLWHRDILKDSGADNLPWAMSASPLIVDDLVIMQPGGSDGWSVAAYHRLTGEIIWHTLDDVQGYTSPMLMTLDGMEQVVTVTAERALGLHIDDGTLLWEYPWVTPTVPSMTQPILYEENHIFLSSGYGHGAAGIKINSFNGEFRVETVWSSNRMKNKFSSSVLHDGYIYGFDEAILACIEAATGNLQWKGGRYGYGQLLLAGDHLIVLTERGELVLVEARPDKHQEVSGFSALEGKTWNVPALAEGRLLVRNAREMAAFDLNVR